MSSLLVQTKRHPIEDFLATVLVAALMVGDFNILCVILEDDLNPTVHFNLERVIFLCTQAKNPV